jgi:hypothetical protein
MSYNYNVKYATGSSGPWTDTGNVATTVDVVTGLKPNTNYYFQITPIDALSNTQGAPTIVGPYATDLNPPPPRNLQVSGIQQRQVTLTWL